MSTVTEISANITHTIDSMPKVGANDVVYIIPETDHQDNITYTGPTAGQITDITSGVGQFAYQYDGANNSVNFGCTSVDIGNHKGFQHTATVRIFDKTAANLEQLKDLLQSGRVRLGVESNGGEACGGLFWLIGYTVGLDVVSFTWDQSSEDEAGIVIELATPERLRAEPDQPLQVFKTNYSTTKALFTALLS